MDLFCYFAAFVFLVNDLCRWPGKRFGTQWNLSPFFFLDCYVYLIPNKASLNPQSSVMNRFIDLNMAFSKTWQISKQIFMFIQVRPDNCDVVDACCFFFYYFIFYLIYYCCFVLWLYIQSPFSLYCFMSCWTNCSLREK